MKVLFLKWDTDIEFYWEERQDTHEIGGVDELNHHQ